MERRFHVYILASGHNGTLYVGMTNDLVHRVWEHREGAVEGFTRKHGVKYLMYFEEYPTARDAIDREKKIKRWPRQWKLALIERDNPDWRDLYDSIAGG